MMGHADLQDRRAISKYLLQKAQHVIGGFGKLAGDPPGQLPEAAYIIVGLSGATRYTSFLSQPCCSSNHEVPRDK